MEKTTNCQSVSNPHFQTRKATKADVSSIAEMIKVRFVTSWFVISFSVNDATFLFCRLYLAFACSILQ